MSLQPAGIGAVAQIDPAVASLVGNSGLLSMIAPLAFALAVVASGWRNLSVGRLTRSAL